MIDDMTLAERLATFAADLRFEDVPAAVVESVKLRALDVVGIALAASTHEVGAPLRAGLESWAGRGECTVIGAKFTASVPLAILANGTLAHGLDFDDTHAASVTHASAVVIPTVLALGEAAGLDGRAVVTAAVAGYEAIARIGMAAPGAFHARGWHASSVCGTFAAALAAGVCERLDRERLVAALGIAGSFASGVMEFLEDGSWVKRLHPGWAGQAGATAAALARAHFSGPATILEGRFGLYRTFIDSDPDRRPFDTLGQTWETLAIGFKPYPCCHYLHAFLDCALGLREAHGITPSAIESIECLVPPSGIPIVCEPWPAKLRPRTPYDAQFSLPFSVAAAFIDGRVGLETYAAERLADAQVLGLAARVSCQPYRDPSLPPGFPGAVRVRLTDGRTVETSVPDGRGGPARPLPASAIVEKFRRNAARALSDTRVAGLERAALGLDGLADVRALMQLCRSL
jgi:2-methylcitrate dehydratase PrpD